MLVMIGSVKGIRQFDDYRKCGSNLYYTLKAYEKQGLYKALSMKQCMGIAKTVEETGKAKIFSTIGYRIERM